MDSPKRPPIERLAVKPREPLDEQSDDDLMLLTRGGMQRAFYVLVRRHQSRVLRVAARYLRDRTLAPDIAQSAFLELFRNRERYEARGRFIAYLLRITINQSHMSTRAARSRDTPHVDVSDMGPSVQDVALRDHRRDLERAIAQLSEKLRVVVSLRYGGDLELAEIAEILELPIGTVKRRLFDAMAKLRELLEDRS
jgi:RNA polymerase sigma-70 factor (ECF subfamily)